MIPVNEPLLDGNEKKYLCECIDSGWVSSEGPFVKRFENAFAARVNSQHAVALTNGSAALELAVAVLDIGEGDEVIMPTFTIISCANAVIRAGATPVLVDVDPVTWNMDVAQVEAKITGKTRAIMVVHTYGLPVDMAPILEIASRHGLRVIEDAAEAHGLDYNGIPCGSMGDIGTFSFYPNKHVTTGEGGMVVTNDEQLAERCRSLRNLCFQASRRFVHEEMGWNMRMTNLQAAVGLAQVERLDEFILKKREMGAYYTQLLQGVNGIQLPVVRTDYAENIYWVYGILLDQDLPVNAKMMMDFLGARKIGTRPFFYPLHRQPVYQGMGLFVDESYPIAEYLSEKGFYIPSGLKLNRVQMVEVAEALNVGLDELVSPVLH